MAYDADLAGRIRELLAGEPAVTEQKMFGGDAFLVGGNLAVAASQEGILVRVARDQVAGLVATTVARPAEMGTRTMADWIEVDAGAFDDDLAGWVERGASYARSLPPK